MSQRRLSIVAWFVWTAGMTLMLGAAALSLANHPELDFESLVVAVAQGTAFLAIGAVGLLIATRRSGNAIGWVYLGVWLGASSIAWVASFSLWATVTNPGVAGGGVATWLNNWLWVPTIGALLTFPLLLFPDGHLPSARWRPFAWVTVAVIAAWSAMFAFEGADYSDAAGHSVPNPYSPNGLVGFFNTGRNVLALFFVCVVIACVGSLVVRFRRGSALERAQIKWLILAGAVSVAFLSLPGDHGGGTWIDAFGGLVAALLPICVGIAILRYHLYEIDRIISRTLSYALVIGAISTIYLVIVTSMSQALPESNALVVAAATLVAATLFRPLLSRVRKIVDRKFNRARYDAEQTASAFAQRLRGGLDPDEISVDLVQAIRETFEPSSVSVWVRQP